MPYLPRNSGYRRRFPAPRLQGGAKRGLGDFSTVASTIQTIEGWFPGSVSQSNNNPGNLKYAGQPGATGADASGFAVFPTVAAGEQALQNQISLDASRGETIAQFAAKYAPAQDSNDPVSYAAQIAAATGLSVNDPLSAADSAATASGIDLTSLVPGVFSSSDGSDDSTLLYWGLGLTGAAGLLLLLASGR